MAARPVPGAGDKPQRRVVPGAPPPAPSKASKKGKPSSKAAADVKVPDAKSAALLQKAPANPNQVANGLKVTSQDLAEQAETQAAVAAVEAVQSSAAPVVDAPSTPAQKVISDRINELSAKSKNATITVAIDELKSLLSKVQVAEAGSAPSSSKAGTESEGKARLVLLLQFLHLFNLFHPNPAGPPSFAPQRIMPPALEMSTGQQVAAVAKIYDQLANGPLEGGGGDALQTLASIERGSKDEVLPDVSFDTIRSMILKLTAPPTANADADADAARAAPTGLDGPSKGFVPLGKASSPASPVSFMQASEILDQSGAEPEGGQPSAVPAEGAEESRKGEQAGAGIVIGDAAATSGKADGTAASAVKEPVNTTVVAEPKLNWAAWPRRTMAILARLPCGSHCRRRPRRRSSRRHQVLPRAATQRPPQRLRHRRRAKWPTRRGPRNPRATAARDVRVTVQVVRTASRRRRSPSHSPRWTRTDSSSRRASAQSTCSRSSSSSSAAAAAAAVGAEGVGRVQAVAAEPTMARAVRAHPRPAHSKLMCMHIWHTPVLVFVQRAVTMK